ncbi:MAG TPA: carbamoyltransferase N-terminal domain-containing protein, partial [Chloroflexota bacterium]|nr:carbamoyltransferase N-terminal domain-containing protein [Chloroflexota bacterium]
MLTLGINAAFHDSAACMVDDGVVVAAAEEERFTGIKHGKRPIPFSAYELPFHAIDYCLSAVDAGIDDVDHVAYSFDPHVLTGPIDGTETLQLPLEPSAASASEGGGSPWDPLFIAHVLNAPRHLVGGVPHHLQKRLSPAQRRYQWHFV